MDIEEFHKTTSYELLAVKNRVKNLINHWPEVGRHKEAVLKNIIRRFLPAQFEIGTGFVVKYNEELDEHEVSRQIDLIIYNIINPVLFKEGDFVIVTPDAVYAIIEVKTNLENNNLESIIKTANENGKFVFHNKVNYPFFNGIFSYEGYSNGPIRENFERAINNSVVGMENESNLNMFRLNHIAFNEQFFYKYWINETPNNRLYELVDLSFSFFISNLIDYLSVNSVIRNNRLWFPIDKEVHIKHSF